MHGSVCLFSRYLSNLLDGENLDELDISSASSSDNVFSGKKTLSTGWEGTCPLVNQYSNIYNNYSAQLTYLNTLITTNHNNLLNQFSITNTLINNLYTVTYITSTRPSGSTSSLIIKSEYEFSDKTNSSLIGGKIYNDFSNNIKTNVESLNGTIKTNINSFINNNAYAKSINDAYENFVKFDTAVATAANVMNKNILDLKDYFLILQFILMFFTWAYMFFFGVIILLYIIYACKKYNILWYFMVILIHVLLIMMLIEIFMSSFFGQVRLICHEVPRAMNFIFTGSYMVSGNSASYPAKFGTGNANITKMFTECLNGDGDLASLFISKSDMSTISNLKDIVTSLYITVKNISEKSNTLTNNYANILNSDLLKSIIKLETMKENLYMATEGFGDDDIYTILNNIRTNLDLANCSMKEEYYVIRASDCPSGSVQQTTISNSSGTVHCYVIQNLLSTTSASYANAGCNNDYINQAINFIREIYSLIDARLLQLQILQDYYSTSFSYLSSEIESVSSTINTTYNMLYSDFSSSTIDNCGSSRFDLIDFCDFIGKTTEYDARIVVVFAAFIGVFGFVLLYAFLNVLNTFETNEVDMDYDDYGYNYGQKTRKIRNINININKSRPNKNESYEQDEDNFKNINNNKKKVPPKSTQKVEMSYISKNNEDSDSS